MGLSASLLGLWTWAHPDVLTHILCPQVADVAQAYALGIVLLSQGTNFFVVGPLTSKYVTFPSSSDVRGIKMRRRVMFQRHKQEKEEGKSYNEAGVSVEPTFALAVLLNILSPTDIRGNESFEQEVR